MSRFGLRSNSDCFKLSEEKANNQKLCKSAKVALKKVYQKKKKSPFLDNDLDAEQITLEKGISNETPPPPISIVCSLPLNRISGIIEKLNAKNTKSTHIKYLQNEVELKQEDLSEEDQDDDEDDPTHQKLQPQVIKIMCLFCDKKFTSRNLQLKHVEKFHTHIKDRRCSGRNSQTQLDCEAKNVNTSPSTSASSLPPPTLSSNNFPGCTFCKKTKVQQQIAASAKDLNGLFIHLTECHADKYFGCKACMMRFQNIGKLSKHMQTVHNSLPLSHDESSKSKDNDTDSLHENKTGGGSSTSATTSERNKSFNKTRLQKSQKTHHSANTTSSVSQSSTSLSPNTIIGAEEPILSRLGLTQNRLPNNRKGVRLRRDILTNVLLKSDQNSTFSSTAKVRSKTIKSTTSTGDAGDVIFRIPTRTDVLSCIFDDNFYKEVVSNVRSNMQCHLDGKILNAVSSSVQATASITTKTTTATTAVIKHSLPHIRSALVKSPISFSEPTMDSEIHAATSLNATTAFPTLLTAEQYGGEVVTAKIRRPHTKNSWKWKWDSVKKYKLINEGGKVVKKMKQPIMGSRDLSKLDMWTQLTMRQKHEMQLQQVVVPSCTETVTEATREERQRLNDQLNCILDLRMLPHIILEQNEQAIIKLENDEFGIVPTRVDEDCTDNIMGQTFTDENFLSVLHLLPYNVLHLTRPKLLLSGEWARPRCYLCTCCGAKFEKLKSLEEHKMFRHSQILSTHYEVVGRELLAGNLLRHFFIPKKALNRYGNDIRNAMNSMHHRFRWSKSELVRSSININAEDESSDSIQSIPNSCTTQTYSIKNSTTDECDTDTKTTIDMNTISPSHSMQSSGSSFNAPLVKAQIKNKELHSSTASSCTKCGRKCSGVLDLYRHMLDCSGDYIWSLAKKRKYRYYCGSKKRRPCNKHNFMEFRKAKQKSAKTQHSQNEADESGSNFSKIKTSPRQRPSDAESIKKMLENLPPKRICKKIFPTVAKVKKSSKAKLISKHKIFNKQVLRKTRARQISQAAKLLSKKKNKFPQKTVTNKKSLRLLKYKRLDIGILKTGSLTTNADCIKKSHIRNEQKKEKAVQVNKVLENDSDPMTDSSKNENPSSKVLTPNNLQVQSVTTDSLAVEIQQNENVASKQSELHDNVAADSTLVVASGSDKNSQCNIASSTIQCNKAEIVSSCNKKRSKKINDCIAMLTGKLEEKLKTEQKVENKTGIITGAESKMSPTNEKKAPKRKALSRRFIKPDINAKLTTPASAIVAPAASTSTLPPVALAPALIIPETTLAPAKAPGEGVLKVSLMPPPPLVKEVADHTPTTFSKVPIPVTLPTVPVTINMLPKVPLFLPVESLRVTTAAAPPILPSLPSLPLPVSVNNVQSKIAAPLLMKNTSPLMPPSASVPVHFLMEPLNLSHVKNTQNRNISQDLTVSTAMHRPSMPARRQTICGFEARDFIELDEVQPLDLSKKSKKIEAPPPPTLQPLLAPTIEVSLITPVLSSIDPSMQQSSVAIPLPPEILLNKQFYSNLELLKIPQVRNPVYSIPPPPTEAPVVITKCTPKKRTNNKGLIEPINKIITTTTSQIKPNNKEMASNKKENPSKNKPIQKMDEVVINHIDDAINSVINAVQASLPDNDEDKPVSTNLIADTILKELPQQQLPIEQSETISKLHESVCEKEPIAPIKQFTPQKRYMRSKTLDCRPSALSLVVAPVIPKEKSVSPTPGNHMELMTAKKQISVKSVAEITREFNGDVSVASKVDKVETMSKIDTHNKSGPFKDHLKGEEISKSIISNIEHNPEPQTISNVVSVSVSENKIDYVKENIALPSAFETNVNSILEENISNINNTSSGFHSSGQPEIVTDQKKTRRRRKNELAAIVADQLLESFKIDKARRDNLKKLENLAYEKSEDLLLTGMLLMSSTKRNASSACSSAFATNNDKSFEKPPENSTTKRQKQDQTKNSKTTKNKRSENVNTDEIDGLVSKTIENQSAPPKNVVIENEKSQDTTKKGKRRQYRRKGKALDNENISKLKSSLESFSIGIEKQLTEIEARNAANLFNAPETKTTNSNASIATKASILRPSILTATLEQPGPNKVQAGNDSRNVISSRDPRLNKNIHKDEKVPGGTHSDGKDTIVSTRARLRSSDEKNIDEAGDFEEDNYLTEIAKNVNDKIMSADNEDFDGFELANDMQDDSNSKYYRPPTSMSVRSAPSFNDDRSNFGSICDENTNTEVMDMDLDDELSVYTSYSQDIGRGRGRRRRRRRSILLKRKSRSKRPSRDLSAEKFECVLCKKTFFTATSLTKHNMTLAHVSKVSEQEYLLSKSTNNLSTTVPKSPPQIHQSHSQPSSAKHTKDETQTRQPCLTNAIRTLRAIRDDENHLNEHQNNKSIENSATRLTLNPDERLFFECCNILKGTETPRLNNDDCNNGATFSYAYQDKMMASSMPGVSLKPPNNEVVELARKQASTEQPCCKDSTIQQVHQNVFRDPQMIPSNFQKLPTINNINEVNLHSPNYSAVSQFSVVTNTTSRFKTKAAMKGYENVNIDINFHHQELESKSRTVCKLTELAEIALGNEKPSTPDFTTPISHDHQDDNNLKQLNTPEYITISVADNQKDCNLHLSRERPKNNETQQSSTSSKTIMHSSIIKAAVEEHNNAPSSKIIIPDRPFKNIGLEEKATITFQKPKASVNLLTDDNSVTTASYSDRDDFDFGSISCDDDTSVKTNNEKNIKNNSSDSSSSRATAKTFENKSLIMGRIFKNASTKAKAAAPPVKVKSVGVQKDQPVKTDLNQLFDELRGEGVAKTKSSEATERKEIITPAIENVIDKQALVTSDGPNTCKTAKKTRKKPTVNRKNKKDISKLQSELGMSPEEIEKLIDEGQRKSKRRCATNRPKKLVEMWSSDEYEEFLSTKDIIALIEEKEKQEKRRKRKNSISAANNSNEINEKDLELRHATQNVENKRKNMRSTSVVDKKEKIVVAAKNDENNAKVIVPFVVATERKEAKLISTKQVEIKEKHARQTVSEETPKKSKEDNNDKVRHNIVSNRITRRKTNNTTNKTNKAMESDDISRGSNQVKQHQVLDCNKEIRTLQTHDVAYDFDNLRRNNLRTRSSTDTKKDNNSSKAKEDVSSIKSLNKETFTAATTETTKKRVSNSNNKAFKNKRKTQANQSPPRRKRLATEKLYYWSSSSDEDFGRINNNATHIEEEDYESGEQYQQHGWIVGDSHKKLVTLLAIAKGNKKVENYGVKKNISKKKN